MSGSILCLRKIIYVRAVLFDVIWGQSYPVFVTKYSLFRLVTVDFFSYEYVGIYYCEKFKFLASELIICDVVIHVYLNQSLQF